MSGPQVVVEPDFSLSQHQLHTTTTTLSSRSSPFKKPKISNLRKLGEKLRHNKKWRQNLGKNYNRETKMDIKKKIRLHDT